MRCDRVSSRPGGTPLVIGGRIMLPVQDCSRIYGCALRPEKIDHLDEAAFTAEIVPALDLPQGAPAK